MSLAGFKSIPLPLAQCSLPAVLKCGQSFRWSVLTPSDTSESASASTSDIAKPDIKEPEAPRVEYRLCLKDRVVCLRQSPTAIYYRSVFPGTPSSNLIASESDATRDAETLAWLRDYFQLDIDLVALYKQWAEKDKVFSKFQERFEGIRILRQDPWENLVSCVVFPAPPFVCLLLISCTPHFIQVHMLLEQQHLPHHQNGAKPMHLLLPVPTHTRTPLHRRRSPRIPPIPAAFCPGRVECRPAPAHTGLWIQGRLHPAHGQDARG